MINAGRFILRITPARLFDQFRGGLMEKKSDEKRFENYADATLDIKLLIHCFYGNTSKTDVSTYFM